MCVFDKLSVTHVRNRLSARLVPRLRCDEPLRGIHHVPEDQLQVRGVGFLANCSLEGNDLLVEVQPEPVEVSDALDFVAEALDRGHKFSLHDERCIFCTAPTDSHILRYISKPF